MELQKSNVFLTDSLEYSADVGRKPEVYLHCSPFTSAKNKTVTVTRRLVTRFSYRDAVRPAARFDLVHEQTL